MWRNVISDVGLYRQKVQDAASSSGQQFAVYKAGSNNETSFDVQQLRIGCVR